ncbi:cyclodeaminase [Gemmatimonadota bacterium]
MAITILTETDLRSCVTMDLEALNAVEEGFVRFAQGDATVPPAMGIDIPEHRGEVHIKSAYVHGLDSFAVKIASGFYGNPGKGLPMSSGMMILLNATTGFPEAFLLDNAYLTELRTGLAGALAAKYLAREKLNTVGVVGAGAQGRYQIQALRLVRDFERLLVFDTNSEILAKYVDDMSAELGITVEPVTGVAELVRDSDLVITATPSRTPYLKAEWMHPGLHITAMGSDGPDKLELEPEAVARADRIVCDRISQCFTLGELHHAFDAGLITEDDASELGELAAGIAKGRQSDEEITMCDLTGVGVQDTAIALLAYQRAMEKGLGSQIQA